MLARALHAHRPTSGRGRSRSGRSADQRSARPREALPPRLHRRARSSRHPARPAVRRAQRPPYASRRMKVVVLTTSYPRSPEDVAGRFVADAVEQVRARGVDVEVVSPLSFHHFGIAYGHGVIGNLRRRPWLALARAGDARRPSRGARPAQRARRRSRPRALAAGRRGRRDDRPAVRRPALGHRRRARAAARRRSPGRSCAARGSRSARRRSSPRAARELGARDVRVIPSGVEMPDDGRRAGRARRTCSTPAGSRAEKGVLRARRGRAGPAARRRRRRAAARPLSPARSGSCRTTSCSASTSAPPSSSARPSARASASSCAEAMAHGRPVVATAVGGLRDLVVDGETGLLVPPGDVAALRAALERLLADGELRRRLGAAARDRAARALLVGAVDRR